MLDKKIIDYLRVIAEDVSPVSKMRLAAAIVYRGRIISVGINQYKTHPFAVEYAKNPSAIFLHAETDAIFKAKKKLTEKQLRKSILYVVRVKYDDMHKRKLAFGNSKPCEGCSRCIEDHGIKMVAYTENSDYNKLKYTVEVL